MESRQLPTEIIARIVQSLSVKDRLTCCALVSKAWKAATRTSAVDVNEDTTPVVRYGQLQAWTQHSGDQLASLQLEGSDGPDYTKPVLQLPCTKLTRLQTVHLTNFDVQLLDDAAAPAQASTSSVQGAAPGSSISAVPAAPPVLPALRHLHISSATLPLDSLQLLSRVTQLTHLHLSDMEFKRSAAAAPEASARQRWQAIGRVLQQLSSLVHLALHDLSGSPLKDHDAAIAALQPLRQLQQLQHLVLDNGACSSITQLLPILPASLTALHTSDLRFEPGATGDYQHLVNLVGLKLSSCSLNPVVLCDLPQLQRLKLREVEILGSGPCIEPGMPATLIKGRAWLLQCIGTLPALQQLTFKNMSLARHKYVQQLSALTASSELTSLRVMETAGAGAPLPQEALQYMFPAGKQMPNIRELQVSAEVYSCERNDTYAPCVTAVDIQRISSACPQLKRLSLSYVVAVDVADSLRSLPRTLRELNIAGHPLGDAAVGAITHLKGLQDLTWLSRTLSSVGLQQLQELSGLTRLHFANNEAVAAFDRRRWPDLEFALAWNAKDCVLQTAPEAPEPDVWMQLRDCLAEEVTRQEAMVNAFIEDFFTVPQQHASAAAAGTTIVGDAGSGAWYLGVD